MEGTVRDKTQIKICGITTEEEIAYLNEFEVAYAGFVFYEKSKRNIAVATAKKISKKLKQDIKKVAVTVSPNLELIHQIEEAGFDILQIHGAFDETLLPQIRIPVWLAVNVKGIAELSSWRETEWKRWREYTEIKGILLDAGDYGSGKTFGWEKEGQMPEQEVSERAISEEKSVGCLADFVKLRAELAEQNISFILAGGLNPENVADGIRLFAPDVVDVSSGVEEIIAGQREKSRERIRAFVEAVKRA